jgi:single-strand DNA-binding protein
MNKCILIGNLTKDPDLKTLPSSGTSVCNFTVAVTRRFANQQGEREVDFIPVVVWRAQAENCAKYLRKGSQVAVWGSIQTRTYEAQDKTRRYVTEIVAEEVKFLSRTAGKGDEPGGGGPSSQPAKRHGEDYDSNMADMQEIDEDMPF